MDLAVVKSEILTDLGREIVDSFLIDQSEKDLIMDRLSPVLILLEYHFPDPLALQSEELSEAVTLRVALRWCSDNLLILTDKGHDMLDIMICLNSYIRNFL